LSEIKLSEKREDKVKNRKVVEEKEEGDKIKYMEMCEM